MKTASKIKYLCIALLLSLCLVACTSSGHGISTGGWFGTAERDVFPGGLNEYDWGVGQNKENFTNVEQAQYDYQRDRDAKWWRGTLPVFGPSSTIGGLHFYYPLNVRWKLKDGREYILEDIDLSPIMREYFKTHSIALQWQKEGRPRDRIGDYLPVLVHQIKDDKVLIEWVVITNKTPVNERIMPNGAATRWDLLKERYLVIILKGKPTSGIDFKKTYEPIKPAR